MRFRMKKRIAVLLTSAALAAGAVAVAPSAGATICITPQQDRVFVTGSCGDIATDPHAPGSMETSDNAYVWGEHPCFTVDNVPYYTPPGKPC
jgi:hypothetical protein